MFERLCHGRAGLACAIAGLMLAFAAGCGEKEEPETTGPVVLEETTTTGTTTTGSQSDQQLATAAATAFLTSADAQAVCDTAVTEALIRSAYGDRAGCIAGRGPQSLAETAQFGNVEIADGSVSLTADARGGTYGSGQKLQMTVIRDGTGAWRVDEVRSNVPVGP